MRNIAPALSLAAVSLSFAFVVACTPRDGAAPDEGPLATSEDELIARTSTYSTLGAVDSNNAFFQELGTNGRSCGTCHEANQGWTITPAMTRAKFVASEGTHVLFKPLDTAVAPNADVSTLEARRKAYALVLSRAVVRIGIGVPATAEFEVAEVDDPYGFATAASLSLYRRPPPIANLKYASTVSWDARLTFPGKTIAEDLAEQAVRATKNHAQTTTTITAEQAAQIVELETTTFSAARSLVLAGDLTAAGARGGAEALANDSFTIGSIYDSWLEPSSSAFRARAREIVARGAKLFGEPRLRLPNGERGSCAGCHDAANTGASSITGRTFDIGIADASRRAADVPLYTLRNKATGETRQVTDPGRGLITGKWADIGKFKVPSLRDLDARPPYFHDGSAPTLLHVVDHYRRRFDADFSDAEALELVTFLSAL